jgi:hypothetical protein
MRPGKTISTNQLKGCDWKVRESCLGLGKAKAYGPERLGLTMQGWGFDDTFHHVRRSILIGSKERLLMMNAVPWPLNPQIKLLGVLITPTCYHHFTRAEKEFQHLFRMSSHMVRAIGALNMASFISQKHREHIAKEHKRVCSSLMRGTILRMLPLL